MNFPLLKGQPKPHGASKTRDLPIQKEMIDTFDKVFGVENSISIEPFTISFDEMEMSNSDNNLTEKTVE